MSTNIVGKITIDIQKYGQSNKYCWKNTIGRQKYGHANKYYWKNTFDRQKCGRLTNKLHQQLYFGWMVLSHYKSFKIA